MKKKKLNMTEGELDWLLHEIVNGEGEYKEYTQEQKEEAIKKIILTVPYCGHPCCCNLGADKLKDIKEATTGIAHVEQDIDEEDILHH